jgi:FtsP/CotA-like multicopper oxidase with cupredoxin domain
MKFWFSFFTAGWLATLVLLISSSGTQATERLYFVAADENPWDYAPLGRDHMMGAPFREDQNVFVKTTPSAVGKTYLKARFREYTDATFAELKPIAPEWEHLGVLGPLIRAEVGDTIKIVFLNNGSRAYSIHPHGVFYEKNAEGAVYNDGTTGTDKNDDHVKSGATHTYHWQVPERAGPGPADPSSIAWTYHSHVDAVKDSNTGLVGAILITAKGQARPDGSPKDVDREFITLFNVFDENQSWLLDASIAKFADPDKVDLEDENFVESNLMHAINGFVFGNLPGLDMKLGDRVRWYAFALGTEVDLHTAHWHGNTGLATGRRLDVVGLLPAMAEVVDMQPDIAGTWMYHCHVNDHITAGMTALYRVHPSEPQLGDN